MITSPANPSTGILLSDVERTAHQFVETLRRNFAIQPERPLDASFTAQITALIGKEEAIGQDLNPRNEVQLITEGLNRLVKNRCELPTRHQRDLLWTLCEGLARRQVASRRKDWGSDLGV